MTGRQVVMPVLRQRIFSQMRTYPDTHAPTAVEIAHGMTGKPEPRDILAELQAAERDGQARSFIKGNVLRWELA
jgi:hypothetical protein